MSFEEKCYILVEKHVVTKNLCVAVCCRQFPLKMVLAKKIFTENDTKNNPLAIPLQILLKMKLSRKSPNQETEMPWHLGYILIGDFG